MHKERSAGLDVRRWRRLGSWLLCLAALLAWLNHGFFSLLGASGDDLSSLAIAAELWNRGQTEHLYDHHPILFNVMDSPAFLDAGAAIGFEGYAHRYVYPPLVAFVMRPVVADFWTLSTLWLAASVLAIVAGVALTFLTYARQLHHPLAYAGIFLLFLVFEPVQNGLWLRQTTAFIFVVIAAALWLARRRPFTAGLLLSTAVFVKLTPAVLVLAWVWRGRWRAAAGTVAGLVALALLSLALCGWAPHREYIEMVRQLSGKTLVAYNSISFSSYITRDLYPLREAFMWRVLDPPFAARVAPYVFVVASAATVWWATRRDGDGDGDGERASAFAEAMALLVMLLAPPISWTHYLLFLVPIAAIALAQLPAGVARRAGVALVVVAAALCSQPFMLDQAFPRLSGNVLIPGATLAPLCLWLLFVAVAWTRVARAARSPAPGVPTG